MRWQVVFCPGSGDGNADGVAGAFAGGTAGGGPVPAAGLFVGAAGAAAAGHGALSGCAGAPDRMVRLARHLKAGTREAGRAIAYGFW